MYTRNKPQQNSNALVVKCYLDLTELLVTLNFHFNKSWKNGKIYQNVIQIIVQMY